MLIEQKEKFDKLELIKNGMINSMPEGKVAKDKKEMIEEFILQNCAVIDKEEFMKQFVPMVAQKNESQAKAINRRIMDVKSSMFENLRIAEGLMMMSSRANDSEKMKKIGEGMAKENRIYEKFGYQHGKFMRTEDIFRKSKNSI